MLGLAAVALQCVEYTVQHFGPTNGAYASVFCGWTALLHDRRAGTMYWLETQVATELRARRSPAARHGDIEDPDRLIAPALDAAVFYLVLPRRDRGHNVRRRCTCCSARHGGSEPAVLGLGHSTRPSCSCSTSRIFYWVGARRTVTPVRKSTAQRWRSGCFYASLAVLAIALASPIEMLSAAASSGCT